MAENPPSFVKWREEFVSQEKGSRLVHFYMEDSNGDSHLAIVGTERSLRHMLYVASEDFIMTRFGFCDKLRTSSLKWRSRREAVEWLSSLLAMNDLPQRLSDFLQGQNRSSLSIRDTDRSYEIIWQGTCWLCSKQLRHYPAFNRNGTTISVHSFALILSEKEERYLAYIEDMYEDKKGEKRIKVRWFHHNSDFVYPINGPDPHPCEVFITHYTQVISAECVDDVATVLTPEDYLRIRPSPSTPFCYRQYFHHKFRNFDLRSLKGYFNQAVLPKGPARTIMQKRLQSSKNNNGPLWAAGPRNQIKPPYSVGQKVEVLSQDSGIRGCWFRCTILDLTHKKVKVKYDDLRDAEDEDEFLEEWVWAYRVADEDTMKMRVSGRMTIRPVPARVTSASEEEDVIVPGGAVDVWRDDGWWEGVVLSVQNYSELYVYLPGGGIFCECEREDVRVSREWVKNNWVEIDPKPDWSTLIPPPNPNENIPKKRRRLNLKQTIQEHSIVELEDPMPESQTLTLIPSTNPKRGKKLKWCRDETLEQWWIN